MHQLNGMKRFAVVAMGAAMLAGAAGSDSTALAQADAANTQAPAAAVNQTPATQAGQTPAPVTVTPSVAVAPQGGVIKGTAKAGMVPLPGVAVTATNTLTGKKFATTTDIDGAFQMAVPRNGRYVVKTELTGFASTTQEVVVNASSENGGLPTQTAEFKMDLASRVASTATQAAGGATGTVARVGRGTQSLTMQGGEDADLTDASAGQSNPGAQLPTMAQSTSDDASNTESIAVSGQQGQTNGLAGFSEDDLRNRIQEMQRNGFANGDIANTLSGVMQTGSFGPGGPGGGFGGPGGGPGGGFGGGGGRGGGGFNGFGGGFRGQNPNAWHGSVAYTGANSALNANSRSFTGTAIDKPQSDRNTLIASFTGTPYIPGLLKANSKQFVFLSVQETHNSNPTTSQIVVPTAAQRLGDLTPAYQAGVAATTIYDPIKTYVDSNGNTVTNLGYGLPYTNASCDARLLALHTPSACIPSYELNQANSLAAQALMKLYPLPNITPNSSNNNYQESFPGSSHSSQISARYNRSFGSTPVRGMGMGPRGSGGTRQSRNAKPTLRQSIAENFSYSHSASSSESFSPLLSGASVSNGYNFSSSYTVGYGRLNSTTTVGWNRSRSKTTNASTDGSSNPAVDDGILVGDSSIYTNPFYYGIPSINMSGQTGVAGLSDTTPSDSINQTISLSEMVSYSHHKHNMRYGFDFRRIHADTIGGSNVLGSFTFSGYSTEGATAQAANSSTGGSAVADFLLGLPRKTAITASSNKIYLRGNSWDGYFMDDWRARSNLTLNYGMRWEYFSPYEEKNGRLVNIEMTGSGSSLNIQNVCGSGCELTTGQFGTPASLVNPEKTMFEPRVAIAWSPKYKWTKNTVVRSGYGMNYNTGQYSRFASSLAIQQPFAVTQTNTLNSSGCTSANMTLSNGFGCSNQAVQSNYGVNPNYRLGRVQTYNLGIQRSLPQGVVVNIDYTGAYAGNLDIVRVPNRNASGPLNSKSTQFNYEDSLGTLRSNALTISARQRMHKGVSLQAAYKYSHSIDDASSVGGSGSSTAQNDLYLGAEESNSSFDQRHTLTVNFTIEPPFGPNRAYLNKGGLWAQVLDGYVINGTFTSSTGGYASPQFTGTDAEVAVGADYLRPNRNPGQSIQGAGRQSEWFNTAAFVGACTATNPLPYCMPANTYGTSSRNSIELPGTLTLNGSLSRTVNFGGTRSFEARITANNALNTVQYASVNTVINSSNAFGEVTKAAAMRSFNYTARFRF